MGSSLVYPQQRASLQALWLGLTRYFAFYNEERFHQALGHQTPNVVYQTAMGGGAGIVDKFNTEADISVPV